ncbi:MAG: tRNA-uridine aminocarboxypropyltransferase [Rhodospirillaceae bacterium]|nr:tRNA-uridine aminocarboxypropyltransferase [Rhodospirillaceae bacterium]
MTDDAPAHAEPCPRCGKTAPLCVCAVLAPVDNRIALLILQHPQEQDVDLGTARLTALALKNAVLKVGLSWANLAKALGRPADAKRWAVLYLGSAGAAHQRPPHPTAGKARADRTRQPFVSLSPHQDGGRGQGEGGPAATFDATVTFVDKKGNALADQAAAMRDLDGLIVLDGSWSQAKALWWRNAWLLKCRRIVLNPPRPSRYGTLRKEPRREGLATIEAAALALARLERRPELENALMATFDKLLAAYRAHAGSRPGRV